MQPLAPWTCPPEHNNKEKKYKWNNQFGISTARSDEIHLAHSAPSPPEIIQEVLVLLYWAGFVDIKHSYCQCTQHSIDGQSRVVNQGLDPMATIPAAATHMSGIGTSGTVMATNEPNTN